MDRAPDPFSTASTSIRARDMSTDELTSGGNHFAAPRRLCVLARRSKTRDLPRLERVRVRPGHRSATSMAMDRFMMANSTPHNLCWLPPLLDVLGTENRLESERRLRPIVRRRAASHIVALCQGQAYCFLMNTAFENFSHDRVEKYMEAMSCVRLWPGFLQSQRLAGARLHPGGAVRAGPGPGQEDVPLCKLVAEAGWEPITRAHSDKEGIHVERSATVPDRLQRHRPATRTSLSRSRRPQGRHLQSV